MMIEILNYKKIDKGCLKSEIGILIRKWGGFIIQPILIFEKDDRKWISLPSKEYKDKEGKTKYYPHNLFADPFTMNEFQKKILDSVEEYLVKKS